MKTVFRLYISRLPLQALLRSDTSRNPRRDQPSEHLETVEAESRIQRCLCMS